MKNQDAIKILDPDSKPVWKAYDGKDLDRCNEACRIAVAAINKQIQKDPDYEGDGYDEDGNMIYDIWICPACGQKYEVDYDDYDYCPNCGQALNWKAKVEKQSKSCEQCEHYQICMKFKLEPYIKNQNDCQFFIRK